MHNFETETQESAAQEVTMNVITPATIREVYRESFGAHTKCENCGAREPLDAEFATCGKCQTSPYCSRACQKTHWKATHKQVCDGGLFTEEAHKLIARLTRRLDRVAHVYGPMISMACSMKFSIHNLNDSKVSPRTHVMMVYLSDTPSPSDPSDANAKAVKRILQIDKVDLKPMTELPSGHLKNLQDGLKFYQDTSKVMAYFLVYETAGGPFLRPIMSSYQDNPFEDSKKRLKKMSVAKRNTVSNVSEAWIQAINDMATGKRPDLFAAAKGN
jgi:ribosomal protein L40E